MSNTMCEVHYAALDDGVCYQCEIAKLEVEIVAAAETSITQALTIKRQACIIEELRGASIMEELKTERLQLLKILDRAVSDLCDGHCKPDSCGRYDACRGCILFNQAKMVREDS